MSDSKINKFKEKLFHREAPVDNDALWAALESHIPQTKKRRVLPFWMLFGLLGFGTLIVLWTKSNENKAKIEVTKSIHIAVLNESNLKESVPFENNTTISNSTKSNDEIQLEAFNQPLEKIHSVLTINNKVTTPNKKLKELEITPQNIPSEGINTEENILLKNQLPSQLPVDISSDIDLMSTQVGNLNTMLSSLPLLSVQKFEIRSTVQMKSIQPQKSTFIKSYWLKPLLITGLSEATYHTNQNETELAKEWNDHTQTLPNLGISLLFGADISRKWSIVTGVEYSRFTSRITLDRNNTNNNSVLGTKKTIIDENGNTSLVTGELTTTTIENYKARWHTYNHIISIPFGVEYYLLNLHRTNVKLMLGANINLADYQTGSIINKGLTIEKFDLKNSPYQVNPFGYYLGGEVEYLLKDNLSIGFGLSLRSNQNKILTYDKTITERLSSVNTFLSLKHIF